MPGSKRKPRLDGTDRKRRVADVDRQVAARIRERRHTLGLSQAEAASAIGITYQQLHKYERAYHRITAGRLFAIAGVLGVEVSYFFGRVGAKRPAKAADQPGMLLELGRNFIATQNHKQQEALCRLAQALAATTEDMTESRPEAPSLSAA